MRNELQIANWFSDCHAKKVLNEEPTKMTNDAQRVRQEWPWKSNKEMEQLRFSNKIVVLLWDINVKSWLFLSLAELFSSVHWWLSVVVNANTSRNDSQVRKWIRLFSMMMKTVQLACNSSGSCCCTSQKTACFNPPHTNALWQRQNNFASIFHTPGMTSPLKSDDILSMNQGNASETKWFNSMPTGNARWKLTTEQRTAWWFGQTIPFLNILTTQQIRRQHHGGFKRQKWMVSYTNGS